MVGRCERVNRSEWWRRSGGLLTLVAALGAVSACQVDQGGGPVSTPSTSISTESSSYAVATHSSTVKHSLGKGESKKENTGGTALAALEALPVKGRDPKTGYSRAQFGQRWADTDRNGCDTRNDILNRDLVGVTHKPGTHDCVVTSGTLHDPYTAAAISFRKGNGTSEAIQIDHVVALSDAWQKGAQNISAADRLLLANDPLNLFAVDGPANVRKSDGDAATWLPPNKAFRCQYVARQVAVKRNYRLWVTPAEHDAIATVLAGCRNQMLPAAVAPTVTWKSRPVAIVGAATAKPTAAAKVRRPVPRKTVTRKPKKGPHTSKAQPHGDSGGLSHVRGGSFCSDSGAHGVTSKGTTLTCKMAKDGRLRWKK